MSVLIKYLSLEAIENTVTCLNYNIDKVIFFGRTAAIEEEKGNISSFLFKYLNCDSKFISIDGKSFETIEEQLKEELVDDCYFDFTGDEGIFEGVAFKVANELDVPVHTFDIWNKRTIVIKKNKQGRCIEDIKRNNPIKLNIRSYVEMIGGYVRSNDIHNGDVDPYLIQLRKTMDKKWNSLANLLASCKADNEYYFSCSKLENRIKINHYNLRKEYVISIIKELNDHGIIEIEDIDKDSFKFRSDKHGWIFTKAGNILEQIVYLNEHDKYDDCLVGLYFSWDKNRRENEIVNEIDVACLKDYQLTFISCKDRPLINEYIYELESVARGFAGNYINMKIVTTTKPSPNLIGRGKELGIKVEYLNL